MAGETPPKTYEIHYDDTVVWGAPFTSSKGIVKDVSRDPNPSKEPIDNNRGAVIGIIVFDKQESFSVQIEAKAGVAPPANCSWIKFQSDAADEGSASVTEFVPEHASEIGLGCVFGGSLVVSRATFEALEGATDNG